MIGAGPMLTVVLISIGGIYVGLFTPNEAAAVGAFLTFIYALYKRSLNRESFFAILTDSVTTTALVFLI